tara:strand:- start:168 stop:416 length:249 start_codon:yes stop_codon:yes gene_type:complete
MQKIINVFAIASFAVSGAVVGSGVYVYLNRASIIDGVKSQIMEAVMGSVGGSLGGAVTDALPDITGPSAPLPEGAGLGIPNF